MPYFGDHKGISMASAPSFGQWIKQRRKALDLTQTELAAQIACAPKTLSMIETGALRPSRQLADLLAVPLELPPAERAAFVQWARSSAPPAPTASQPPPAYSTPAVTPP